ncbi:MAG: hypothetical protein Q4D89_12345 [Arachnia propionica]|uniref:hypothetical protein n=1 Tax=Arachnia propionica TaxID=1750 RepID=UPI002702D39A|nr:hypothetical protein [Arachnia propionica]
MISLLRRNKIAQAALDGRLSLLGLARKTGTTVFYIADCTLSYLIDQEVASAAADTSQGLVLKLATSALTKLIENQGLSLPGYSVSDHASELLRSRQQEADKA